ncbi:hypothetical protein [Bradyrhizobium oligotrophicum]|uniref:hypothetical protein n=1 Tax=Bradyrhizobium oligotrophicum TaxID=44255 RepID=UPI003EB82114
MRVVRTDIYFQLPRKRVKQHLYDSSIGSFAFAWFKAPSDQPIKPTALASLFQQRSFATPVEFRRFVLETLAGLTELSIRDEQVKQLYLTDLDALETFPGRTFETDRLNILAELLYEESVVVERSPPQAIPAKELIMQAGKRGGAIVVGTFVGWSVAPESYLAFLSIPLGILVVGSAIGVSRGLENGLQAYVENLFAPAKPPPKPPTPPNKPRKRATKKTARAVTVHTPSTYVRRQTRR